MLFIMNHLICIFLLFSALILTACNSQEQTKRDSAATAKKSVPVRVQKMEKVPMPDALEFAGVIEEDESVLLSFATPGTLKSFNADNGAFIKRGTVIATLDETSARNAYGIAKATLDQAEDAYARMGKIHDNKSLSDIQWAEVESKYKQAMGSEQIAKKSLDDCRLIAPFSGFVMEKYSEIGQNVMPGAPLLKLAKIEKVKAKIDVPEKDIHSIKTNQKVSVFVAALNKTFQGTVNEKGIVGNSLSRTYEVRATINNAQKELLPGMLCNAKLKGENSAGAFILPPRAINLGENSNLFVWVSDNGKARKRFVKVSENSSERAVISEGLNTGDLVIVDGQNKVSSGTEVNILQDSGND